MHVQEDSNTAVGGVGVQISPNGVEMQKSQSIFRPHGGYLKTDPIGGGLGTSTVPMVMAVSGDGFYKLRRVANALHGAHTICKHHDHERTMTHA